MYRFCKANRSESRILRSVQIISIGYMIFLTFMLLYPDPLSLFGFSGRISQADVFFSWSHILIFTLLGVGVFFSSVPSLRIRMFFVLLFYGLGTEIIQIATGRSFEWIDVLQDWIGILIGYGLGWIGLLFDSFRIPKEFKENGKQEKRSEIRDIWRENGAKTAQRK